MLAFVTAAALAHQIGHGCASAIGSVGRRCAGRARRGLPHGRAQLRPGLRIHALFPVRGLPHGRAQLRPGLRIHVLSLADTGGRCGGRRMPRNHSSNGNHEWRNPWAEVTDPLRCSASLTHGDRRP